jgi:hypothetical protein
MTPRINSIWALLTAIGSNTISWHIFNNEEWHSPFAIQSRPYIIYLAPIALKAYFFNKPPPKYSTANPNPRYNTTQYQGEGVGTRQDLKRVTYLGAPSSNLVIDPGSEGRKTGISNEMPCTNLRCYNAPPPPNQAQNLSQPVGGGIVALVLLT